MAICGDLKEGLITNISKMGDLSQFRNWRGITLVDTTNKMIAQFVYKRLSKSLDPHLRNKQAGFIPRISCTDHINTPKKVN